MNVSRVSNQRMAVIGLLALCTGCGGGLSEGTVKKALAKSLGDGDVCWATTDMANTSFPIRVSADPSAPGMAILVGLASSGLIETSRSEVSRDRYGMSTQQVADINLTDAGKAAKAWDAQKGFCLGRKEVTEVRWTEPNAEVGQQVVEVFYKWRIVDQPGWAEGQIFSKIPGMSEPVDGSAILRKMNDGWEAVGL